MLKTVFYNILFPTRQEGVVRFYVGIHVCDASTPRPHPVSRQSSSPVDPAEYPARGSPVDPSQYPARAACQWIPLSIPEQLASGSRRVSRQSGSPVDPAEYPAGPAPAQHPARAARQWIPPSIPPERLASGSRRVSHQSSPAMGIVREWIPSSITPASGSRQVSHHSSPPVESAEYPAEYPLSVDPAEYPANIEPERLASIRQWIPPVSRQSSSPDWFCCWCPRVRSAERGAGGGFCRCITLVPCRRDRPRASSCCSPISLKWA